MLQPSDYDLFGPRESQIAFIRPRAKPIAPWVNHGRVRGVELRLLTGKFRIQSFQREKGCVGIYSICVIPRSNNQIFLSARSEVVDFRRSESHADTLSAIILSN